MAIFCVRTYLNSGLPSRKGEVIIPKMVPWNQWYWLGTETVPGNHFPMLTGADSWKKTRVR